MNAPYPKLRVVLGYTLLSGALGGLLMGLFLLINSKVFPARNDFYMLLAIIKTGALFGLIPALATGIGLMHWLVKIDGLTSYCKVFMLGALATTIYWLGLWWLIGEIFRYFLTIGTAIGGLTAVMLAPFVLPTSEEAA